MPAVPKPSRVRCSKYLDWLKGWPCIVDGCQSLGVDPHHISTVGAGGSDLHALPFCRKCHAMFHSKGSETFERKFVPQGFPFFQAEYLSRFVQFLLTEKTERPAPRAALRHEHVAYSARGNTYQFRKPLSELGWVWNPEAKLWQNDSGAMPWEPEIATVRKFPGVFVTLEGDVGG